MVRRILWQAAAIPLLVGLFVPLMAQVPDSVIVGERITCTDGQAGVFGCQKVDLLSFLPISALGADTVVVDTTVFAVTLNDIWGWTDLETGKEYALVGRSDGTAMVDISDPVNPVFLGLLPSHGLTNAAGKTSDHGSPNTFIANNVLHGDDVSLWRDVKTYNNYAVIVADNIGAHGLQIFDLTQLRSVSDPPVTFTETAHYDGFDSAHNVAVNEETGFAYVVGANGDGTTCGGGLHMIDIQDPMNPEFAGCFADQTTGIQNTGYTHDVQCVIYSGPDVDYQGREICFGSNETAISIADVTDKQRPVAISTGSYPTRAYIHQGWLTEDQRYFLQDDELDETTFDINTRTIIWDLADLDEPVILTEFFGTTTAIDHNQYVVGNYSFQANYKAGLRILDISNISEPVEVGYFDTYPENDTRGFEGAWSNYPFFESGVVVVSSIDEGLFVLEPVAITRTAVEETELPSSFELTSIYPNPFNPRATVTLTLDSRQHISLDVYDTLGRLVTHLYDGDLEPGTHTFTLNGDDLPSGTYLVRAAGEASIRIRPATLIK